MVWIWVELVGMIIQCLFSFPTVPLTVHPQKNTTYARVNGIKTIFLIWLQTKYAAEKSPTFLLNIFSSG